ncbi:hypothetical protein M758_7G011800 [Ceratodon purpureus]|nr:hypothetical protein M758_7G011800 [Ceratodon purpureus]
MPQEPVIQRFLQQKLNPRRTTASLAHSLTESPNVSKLRSATNAYSTITTAKHLTPPNRTPRTQTFTDTDNNKVHSKIGRHQKKHLKESISCFVTPYSREQALLRTARPRQR